MVKIDNIFPLKGSSIGDIMFQRTPTIEEFQEWTLIYCMQGFSIQKIFGSTVYMYYIPKYDKICGNVTQLQEFANIHSKENFLLLDDCESHSTKLFGFVNSDQNGNVNIKVFNNYPDANHMRQIFEVSNIPGKISWGTTSYDINAVISATTTDRYNTNTPHHHFTIKNNYSKYRYDNDTCASIDHIELINEKMGVSREPTTYEILQAFFSLKGYTRLVTNIGWRKDFEYEVSATDDGFEAPEKRYGFNKKLQRTWSNSYHTTSVFAEEAVLTDDTENRVKQLINHELELDHGQKFQIGCDYRYSTSNIREGLSKAILVITKPVGNHRRPTYHYIKGFKFNDTIDIIELARGELKIQDMTPVTVYYLNSETGDYCEVNDRLGTAIKNQIIKEAEIDKVSLKEWTETKSLHPELIKTLYEYTDKAVDLTTVNLFNTLPFGVLFLEQLVKTKNLDLAISIAKYITERADNMNYVCSSLSDILPGCNPEGTTLSKILNFNKPCVDLLFNNNTITLAEDFIEKYKIIKKFIPTGIVTKENADLIDKITFLYIKKDDWYANFYRYSLATGKTVSILDYPQIIKTVYKMVNRIDKTFPSTSNSNIPSYYRRESFRHYQEMVQSYLTLLDMNLDPEHEELYIEFSLQGSPAEVYNLLRERENHANQTMRNYSDMINSIVHKEKEINYAYRKQHALSKLEDTKTKRDLLSSLKGWIISAPTQIYGLHTPGSIQKEGEDMRHCVFRNYASNIADGSYTVLYLRKVETPDVSCVTIGIDQNGRINQTYGIDDRQITSEQAAAIAEWAESKKGLVTFKSESIDMRPGGWPYSVEIPNLPKPDGTWLLKLRTVKE